MVAAAKVYAPLSYVREVPDPGPTGSPLRVGPRRVDHLN
jgi:hypothetical protein